MKVLFVPPAMALALALAAPAPALSQVLPTADVRLSATATDAQTVPSLGAAVSPVVYTFTATNNGPGAASGARLTIELRGNQPIQEATASSGACEVGARVVVCEIGSIASGSSESAGIRTLPADTNDLSARGSVTTATIDPNADDNFAVVAPRVVVVEPERPPRTDSTRPDTRIASPRPVQRRGAAPSFRGTASDVGSGVTFVEVAVQRVSDGACRSLTGPRGRFTGAPCAKRRWLRAAGAANWRFKLRRPLPRGRYRVYSRATDGVGLTEQGWSRPDGNVVRFTVR